VTSRSESDDVYSDEPWLSIRWDNEHECVHSEWKAFATSAEFRAGLMKGLKAIQEKHSTRYLTDSRKVKVIVREDQQWVNETWIPVAAAAGLRRLAVVLADTGLGKMTVEEIVNLNDNERGVLSQTFTSVREAMKWLAVDEEQTKDNPR
jgi:hypothetical protein